MHDLVRCFLPANAININDTDNTSTMPPFSLSSILKSVFGKNLKEEGWKKIAKNLSSAAPGSRAYPISRNKDEEYNLRLDFGEKFVGTDGNEYRNLVLQPNKGAKHEVVRKLAAKDSHQKLAVFAVAVKEEVRGGMDGEGFISVLEDAFEKKK